MRPFAYRTPTNLPYRPLAALVVIALIITYVVASYNLSSNRALVAAEDLGYTHVKVTSTNEWPGYVQLRCSDDDTTMWTVTGIAPSGEQRTIYVCAGLFWRKCDVGMEFVRAHVIQQRAAQLLQFSAAMLIVQVDG